MGRALQTETPGAGGEGGRTRPAREWRSRTRTEMARLLIGEVARRAGVSRSTVRYYEEIGLLPLAMRSSSGYRWYPGHAIEELRFIRKAQALGFSLDEIGEILRLSRSGKAPCSRVLSLAHQHLAAVEDRIRQLQRFRDHLEAQLARWDGKKASTGHGLCQIIVSAETGPAYRERLERTPNRSARRKKHYVQVPLQPTRRP